MKCIMCGAVVKPVITAGGLKLCPKCKSYMGRAKPKKIRSSIQGVTDLIDNGRVILDPKDSPKDTKGKYKPHLVLGSLTRAIARVREYGVKKYGGEDGWKQQTPMDYMDAIGRHYNECRNDPQARDDESGLLHIAQIATNAMFIIDMLKKQGIDLDTMKETR